MTPNEFYPKKAYIEMYDALRDLNGALTSLLRLNWLQYPWSKEIYYNLSRQYDILRDKVNNQRHIDKSQITNLKQDYEA